MRKPTIPTRFTIDQWTAYVEEFVATYESYRVGACVWLCPWGGDSCIEADHIQAAAHDYHIRRVEVCH